MWVSTAAIRVIGRSPAKNLNFTQRLSLSFDALHRQLSAHCSRQSWFSCRWSPLHEHLDRSARSAHPAWPERRSPASDQGKFNRLSALPQGQAAELGQVLDSFYDGQEVIASKLPDLAGETDAAIGEQDFSLADAAGVEEELTRGGIARRALVAEAEVKPTEWDPACFAAPPHVDQALPVWQHALKSGASQRGGVAFKASPERKCADGDKDISHDHGL